MPKDAIAEKAKDTIVLNKTVTEVLAVLLSEGAHQSISIELSFGVPNYKERIFIKAASRAKEPFPIKKVQVQMPPKKRK